MAGLRPTHALSPWQWLYAAAVAGVIVWASGHGQVAEPNIVNFDKAAHFSVFGLLATLVLRPFRQRHAAWAAVIVSAFGATDEFHQSFTPGRSMDYHDWIADTTGAIVAVAAYSCWPLYRGVLETALWKRKPKIETSSVPTTTETPLSS